MLDGNRLGDRITDVAATVGDRIGSGYHDRAGAVHHIAVAYRHVLCGAAVIDGKVCRLKLGHGRHRRGVIHGATAHLFCCQCTRDGRFYIVIDVVGECPCRGEICAVRVSVGVGLRAYAVLLIRLPSQRLCRIIVGIKYSAALVLDDRQCGGCYCLRQAGHIGGRCHRTILCRIHGVLDGNRLGNSIAGVAATVGDRVGSGYHDRAGASHRIAVVHRHALYGAAVADGKVRRLKLGHGRHRIGCRSHCATAHLNRCQRARECRNHIVVDVVGECPGRGEVCTVLIGVGVGLPANTVLLARLPSHFRCRISDRGKHIVALVLDDRQHFRSRFSGQGEAGHIGGIYRRTNLIGICCVFDGNRLGDRITNVAAAVGDRVGSGYHNRAGAVHHIAVAYRHALCGAAVIDGKVCRLKLGHGRHRRGVIHGATAHLLRCQRTRDGRRYIVVDIICKLPCLD